MLASIAVHFEKPNVKSDCWQVLILLPVNAAESFKQQCVILIPIHRLSILLCPLALKDNHFWEQLIHLEIFFKFTVFVMTRYTTQNNKNKWKQIEFSCQMRWSIDWIDVKNTVISDLKWTLFFSVVNLHYEFVWILGSTATWAMSFEYRVTSFPKHVMPSLNCFQPFLSFMKEFHCDGFCLLCQDLQNIWAHGGIFFNNSQTWC